MEGWGWWNWAVCGAHKNVCVIAKSMLFSFSMQSVHNDYVHFDKFTYLSLMSSHDTRRQPNHQPVGRTFKCTRHNTLSHQWASCVSPRSTCIVGMPVKQSADRGARLQFTDLDYDQWTETHSDCFYRVVRKGFCDSIS